MFRFLPALLLLIGITSLLLIWTNIPDEQPFRPVTIVPVRYHSATPTPNPAREQYYRGIYDACLYFRTYKRSRESCQALMARAMNHDWYEQSLGEQWK